MVKLFFFGGNDVKNFIPVMRAKRLIEMKSYIDKGYEIQDKKHYCMLEYIKLEYMNEQYEYGIQVTQRLSYINIVFLHSFV
jgi:hypothetical protein